MLSLEFAYEDNICLNILDRIVENVINILYLMHKVKYSRIKVSVCCAKVALVSGMFNCMIETLT